MGIKPFSLMDDELFLEYYHQIVAPTTMDRKLELVFERASGTRLWDSRGKEYLEFGASVGVTGVGQLHPKIVEMAAKMLEKIGFIEGTGFAYRVPVTVAGKPYEVSNAALADTILPLMFPGRALRDLRFLPEITGGTAINASVKLCMKANTGRRYFLPFERAFHGRHGYSNELTNSKEIQKKGYVFSGTVQNQVPFPDSYESMKRAFELFHRIPMGDVNAFVLEYLQGEGGFRWPNVQCMDKLLKSLRSHGIFIVPDEIQSGLGRTGKWFAHQHGNVAPDVVVVSKTFGGGICPVAGIGYDRAMFDYKDDSILETGWHSGTWPGYPFGTALAIMFLDIMEEEHLVENAEKMGKDLTEILQKYCIHKYDSRADDLVDYCVRTGYGLMQGLEFRKYNGEPHPEWRNVVLKNLREADPIGILASGAGHEKINPVIRFEPSLTVTKEDIDCLDNALSQALYKNKP